MTNVTMSAAELGAQQQLPPWSDDKDSTSFKEQKVKTVAVVGFGPCGAAAVAALYQERQRDGNRFFEKVVAFERRTQSGGLWNYSDVTKNADDCVAPQETARPGLGSCIEDPPLSTSSNGIVRPGALYNNLYGNVPVAIMPYHHTRFNKDTPLFADRHAILDVTRRFARSYEKLVHFGTNVLDIRREDGSLDVTQGNKWRVTYVNEDDDNTDKTRWKYDWFDAIVMATGNYDLPYIPKRRGLKEYSKVTKSVIHSKYYRKPEDYRGKTVVVIGNAASGADIAQQLARYAEIVLKSVRSIGDVHVNIKNELRPNTPLVVGDVVSFHAASGTIRFRGDVTVSNIDTVIFCTGYLKTYSMLSSLISESPGNKHPLITDGLRVRDLHRQMFWIHDTTLAFVGLPRKVVPMRMAEVQGAFIARVWSGKMNLPSFDSMMKEDMEIVAQMKSNNAAEGTYHDMPFPKDVDYSDGLLLEVMTADAMYFVNETTREPLPNYNAPFLPEQWTREQRLVREQMASLKEEFTSSL